MSGERLSRRAVLAGAALCIPEIAFARGRTPLAGRAQLRVPWPTASLDPHRLDDATAAIFGSALFDTLYAFTDATNVAPSLAESEPEIVGADLRVHLRSGVTTARDVIASIARARGAGAQAWLADVPTPRKVDDATVAFAARDAAKLARTLASPLTAIVPASFSPASPTGTGPMRADRRDGALVLARSSKAARGPSFLDEVMVHPAPDLAASLRSFESGADDVGWLGMGYHDPRAGARPFDAGAVAWAVLRTGSQAGAWDAPGTAQRMCDGIVPSKLSYLVLGPAWTTDKDEGWGGAPCELLVRDDAPWLVELAKAVAATLSRAGHEVVARPIPASDFVTRRAARSYALAIDVVRPLAPGALGALAGLATSSDATSAVDAIRHPPRLTDVSARSLTRTLRVGVLGDIRAQGGRIPDLSLPTMPDGSGVDWGAATRTRR